MTGIKKPNVVTPDEWLVARKRLLAKEKELTDRALKLAEVGKLKSNWELQGLLGLAAFVAGFLVAK